MSEIAAELIVKFLRIAMGDDAENEVIAAELDTLKARLQLLEVTMNSAARVMAETIVPAVPEPTLAYEYKQLIDPDENTINDYAERGYRLLNVIFDHSWNHLVAHMERAIPTQVVEERQFTHKEIDDLFGVDGADR